MSKERINPLSGKRQIKIEPDGLPAIWIDAEAGFCNRCKPFNECLGLNDIDKNVWTELNNLLSSINKEYVNTKLNRSAVINPDVLIC